MDKLPKKVEIKSDKLQTVICEKLIRSLPGKRAVYDGTWNNTEVIIKIFTQPVVARIKAHREHKRMNTLKQMQIPAPEVLFYGRTETGWAVVTKKILDSRVVFEMLENETTKNTNYDILKQVFEFVADMHSKGIIQRDLHTGNFLTNGEKIYALDTWEMNFHGKPLSRKKSLKQLAVLIVSLPVYIRKNYKNLLQAYYSNRKFNISENDNVLLTKYIARWVQKAGKKALKKSLRNSKNYLVYKSSRVNAVFRKDFACKIAVAEIIRNIDELMAGGEIMKNGNTCFVSKFKTAGKLVVAKRYNHKGLWHCVRHTLKGSRAKKSWLNAHALLMLGIKTPEPLGFIEIRKAGLLWKSYIITEYVQAAKLHDFLENPDTGSQNNESIKNALTELMDELAEAKIVHGDMKQSNILIQDGDIILTDLDAMKIFKSKTLFNLRKYKDINSLRDIGLSKC